jgi:hypothetical protein
MLADKNMKSLDNFSEGLSGREVQNILDPAPRCQV